MNYFVRMVRDLLIFMLSLGAVSAALWALIVYGLMS